MAKDVLIVDDSQVDRTNLENILSEAGGYSLRMATNGQEALDEVAKKVPDVVLMDVNMPVMDGFAATRALRNDAATKDLPVILVTSKDQKADKAWGKMLGAFGYITKPYSDSEILDLVAKI